MPCDDQMDREMGRCSKVAEDQLGNAVRHKPLHMQMHYDTRYFTTFPKIRLPTAGQKSNSIAFLRHRRYNVICKSRPFAADIY